MRWVAAIGLGVVLVLVGISGVMLLLSSKRWKQRTDAQVASLDQMPRVPGAVSEADPAVLKTLPPPVQRYFAFVLPPEQPRIARARIRHEGTFAQQPGEWVPFTSVEHFRDRPRAFVWDATLRTMPLIPVRVRDSYVAGEGRIHGAIGGLVTVVRQEGTPELASGALLRWLAEAVWFPTALLPGDGLSWEAIDEQRARVRLTDAGVSVALEVTFGADGGIEEVAADRYKDENGTATLLPWVGRHWDYRRVDGIAIPHAGEVSWIVDGQAQPYWRGEVVEATFEYVARRGPDRASPER